MAFNAEIREQFQFLSEEYGLTPTDVCANVVEFVGERCRVMITVEQDGQIVVKLQSNEPQIIRRRGFTLDAALRFLDPSVRVKAPSGVPGPHPDANVEAWLAAYARLLREYGNPSFKATSRSGRKWTAGGERRSSHSSAGFAARMRLVIGPDGAGTG